MPELPLPGLFNLLLKNNITINLHELAGTIYHDQCTDLKYLLCKIFFFWTTAKKICIILNEDYLQASKKSRSSQMVILIITLAYLNYF